MKIILYVIKFFAKNIDSMIAGAVLTIIIALASKGYYILNSYFKTKKYKGYIGNFFIYHPAPSGRSEICVATMKIKHSFGNFFVEAESYEFKYRGSLEISDSNIFITLKGVEHKEQWNFIFFNPLHQKLRMLWGVSSAISVVQEPCAMRTLISAREIDKCELEELFSKYDNTILRTEKDLDIYEANRVI